MVVCGDMLLTNRKAVQLEIVTRQTLNARMISPVVTAIATTVRSEFQ